MSNLGTPSSDGQAATLAQAPALTVRDRYLSLSAVVAAAFGVGVSFGIGFPLTALTFEVWQQPAWIIGLAAAMPALAVLCALPFLPSIVGRIGAVTAIASGCGLAALCFAALSAVDSPLAWIALRFVMSAGIALPWLVGETWINTVTTDDIRGRVIALYAIAFFSGFSIGPLIVDALGHTGIMPFLAGAAGAALAGVPIVLARRLAPDLAHDNPGSALSALRLAPLGMLGGFIGGFAEITYLSLFPNVAMAAGVSISNALWLLSVMTIGGGVLQFPIGWLADKVDRVAVMVMLAAVFIALSLLLPWAMTSALAAPVTAFVLGGVMLGFYTLGLAIVGAEVKLSDLAAANAAFLIMYQLGAILGPVAAGVAMTASPVTGFIATVCVLMILTGLIFAVLVRPRPEI